MRNIKFNADIKSVGLPFIVVDDGPLEGLCLLVDTGSNNNVMFNIVYEYLKEVAQGGVKELEEKSTIYGLDGQKSVAPMLSAKLNFGGEEFKTEFLVSNNDETILQLSKDVGFDVHGIIGTNFMREHNWIIDLVHQQIRCEEDEGCSDAA